MVKFSYYFPKPSLSFVAVDFIPHSMHMYMSEFPAKISFSFFKALEARNIHLTYHI